MFGGITFRGSHLSGFVRCGKRLSGRGQRRHFDGGEADFTSVIENKSAAVDDAADRCIYDCLAAADSPGPAVLRQRAAAPARRCNRSAQNAVPPPYHRRQVKGRNAATLRQVMGPLDKLFMPLKGF
jgi:hypothetical protein